MKEEGINGFYRGITTNLVRTIPNCILTFVSYELLRKEFVKIVTPSNKIK